MSSVRRSQSSVASVRRTIGWSTHRLFRREEQSRTVSSGQRDVMSLLVEPGNSAIRTRMDGGRSTLRCARPRAVLSMEATSVAVTGRRLVPAKHVSACARLGKSGRTRAPSLCDGESGRVSGRRHRCQADGGAARAVLRTSSQRSGTSVNGSESAFALMGSMATAPSRRCGVSVAA